MKKTLNKEQKTLFITAEQNGFDMLTRNISRNTFLSDSAKALYIYINSHSENFNLSAESIAKYFNKSYRTIQRDINELRKQGFLTLIKKENSNCYYYKLNAQPKKEHLKEYTKESILNAYYKNLISHNDLFALFEKKIITQKLYNEILDDICRIAKTKWLDDEE